MPTSYCLTIQTHRRQFGRSHVRHGLTRLVQADAGPRRIQLVDSGVAVRARPTGRDRVGGPKIANCESAAARDLVPRPAGPPKWWSAGSSGRRRRAAVLPDPQARRCLPVPAFHRAPTGYKCRAPSWMRSYHTGQTGISVSPARSEDAAGPSHRAPLRAVAPGDRAMGHTGMPAGAVRGHDVLGNDPGAPAAPIQRCGHGAWRSSNVPR